MKRIINSIFALIVSMLFVISCAEPETNTNNEDKTEKQTTQKLEEGNEAPEAGYLRIHWNGVQANPGDLTTWSVWTFKDVETGSGSNGEQWPDGYFFTHCDDFGLYIDVKLNADPQAVGFVVVDRATGTKGSSDTDVVFNFPKKYKEIFIKNGSNTVYVDKNLEKEPSGLVLGSITARDEITIALTGINSVTKEDFEVKDKNDSIINVIDATTATLTIDDTDYINKAPYTVNFKNEDTIVANIASELLDEEFAYNGNDLGWHNGIAKVWAPLATKAEILIYDDMATAKADFGKASKPSVTPVAMTNEGNGVWSAEVPEGKYYMYQLVNDGVTYRVCDIYANAASPDSVAAKAVDIANKSWSEAAYTNPWGNNGTVSKKYTEAVIYEMHIRDWSRAFVKNSTGKFEDITNALKNNGAFAQHLKDLGVTHVQILPMFDYAQTNSDPAYNWGYNPYQYNVPEGRYVNGHDLDAEKAVDQMRDMIAAFHDAGIAVNMDVVYNHTAGTGEGSLFDMTVPKYYYRLNGDGNYSNGSGCGNETASNAAMFRKFMIDSLKHWMTNYHINGFRFDLMGLHEIETMKEIYDALKVIDPNVMVYGEPWTGGTAAVKEGITSDTKNRIDECSSSTTENGVACFNDDYRNAIKGAEYGGFKQGHVQGLTSGYAINCGLMGSIVTTDPDNKTGKKITDVVGRSLNYVECHDNYTLADKLAISLNGGTSQKEWKAYKDFTKEQQDNLRAQNKLAAAFVFLAQGTPFINGGQEFMRTKKGDENSYKSEDEINQIDLEFKKTYNDVYNVYKGLIALRKSSDAFTAGTGVLAETATNATGKKIGGLTKYVTTGSDASYCVYFNATAKEQTIDTTGYSKFVDVTSGAVKDSTTLPTVIGAKNFVILKK